MFKIYFKTYEKNRQFIVCIADNKYVCDVSDIFEWRDGYAISEKKWKWAYNHTAH